MLAQNKERRSVELAARLINAEIAEVDFGAGTLPVRLTKS